MSEFQRRNLRNMSELFKLLLEGTKPRETYTTRECVRPTEYPECTTREEELCEECDHPVRLHDPEYGCEYERGDRPGGEGYNGPEPAMAMGPCSCKFNGNVSPLSNGVLLRESRITDEQAGNQSERIPAHTDCMSIHCPACNAELEQVKSEQQKERERLDARRLEGMNF